MAMLVSGRVCVPMVPTTKGFTDTKVPSLDKLVICLPRNGCLALSLTIWSLVNSQRSTTQKINIEPGNDGLEDYFPLPGVYSQVPC